ncbi:MAG: methyltransferase domain-containing protein [Acidobacteriota bacterium]
MQPSLVIPDRFLLNAPKVLAMGPPAITGRMLLYHLAARTGIPLEQMDLLDYGCGSRFADAIVNLDIPIKSYTGVDVKADMVEFLDANVRDERLSFHYMDAFSYVYNKAAPPLDIDSTLPEALSGRRFGVISMFSVLTHQTPENALYILTMLRRYVADAGMLFFTANIEGSIEFYAEKNRNVPTGASMYSLELLAKLLRMAGWRVSSLLPRFYSGLPMMESLLCLPMETGASAQ